MKVKKQIKKLRKAIKKNPAAVGAAITGAVGIISALTYGGASRAKIPRTEQSAQSSSTT